MQDIPVVILCGGMGTRLKEETETIPKPMVSVGGRPILWHLMKYYSSFGFHRFVLCLGYKGEIIKHYFLNFYQLNSSFTITIGKGETASFIEPSSDPWTISCVDTGERAMTGARVKRVQPYIGNSCFMLTYGDGLCDLNLNDLLAFHKNHKKLVTVTGVHPPSRFGLLTLKGTQVVGFAEKPQTAHDYINGGFFICEPGFFNYLEDRDSCVLEREPLERVVADRQMEAFLHNSYWQCMDTARDRDLLEEAWAKGAPWKKW